MKISTTNSLLDSKYFLELAKKIYLSPSQGALDKCVSFSKDAEEDLLLLRGIDTSREDCYHKIKGLSISYESLSEATVPSNIENKDLLHSVLKDYAISNIKKT